MNQVHVSGKVVMLSGGAGGLGRALADLVLTRGGDVFLCDTSEDELKKVKDTLEKKHGDRKIGVTVLDVRHKVAWENAWKACEENVGVPTVLVNIAGIKGETDWENVYDVNLKGVHLGIETAVNHLSREKGGPGGIVINISSTCGVTCQGDMFATPAYTASKHAVTALTRTFGHKFWFEKTGVSVAAVAPSYIATPFLGDWSHWTEDLRAQLELKKSAEGKNFLSPDEAALKIFNIFNSQSGSVWLIRPGMMPPFNIPDYRLPQPKIL